VKVGDLVKMDFELEGGEFIDDAWGIGVIVEIFDRDYRDYDDRRTNDIHVLWPGVGLSWEMSAMLEVMDEER
jgi:hypothetical protein